MAEDKQQQETTEEEVETTEEVEAVEKAEISDAENIEEDLLDENKVFPYGPKGPNSEVIDGLKETYGNLQLTEVAGNIYIYRLMLREEHMELVASGALDGDDSELITVETLLVWPDPKEMDWDKLGAGVIPTLATDMLQFSGFIRLTQPIKL